MGVSFKIAKVGSRYRPKVPPLDPPDPVTASGVADASSEADGGTEATKGSNRKVNLLGLLGIGPEFVNRSVSSDTCEEPRASFSLNLFPNGFSVGKPTEGMLLPLLEDAPKSLHPYDRASMTLFSAIEYGWLPGDLFDDIPCKYFNGTIICEVWDYRTCLSKLGNDDSSRDEFPKSQKVCLRMGMENVVKDLPSILNDSCSYNDLLEVESRITRALQPELFLSPDPSLDRLCGSLFRKQLDLGICKDRFTRKQNDVLEMNLQPTDMFHVRDISRNVCFESLKPQTHVRGGAFCSDKCAISISMPNVQQNDMSCVSEHALPVVSRTNYNSALHWSSAPNKVAVTYNSLLTPDQTIKDSSSGLKNFVFLTEKRDSGELELVHEPFSKRPKQDTPYCQHFLSQRDSLFQKKLQKNITLSEKQIGIQTTLQPRIDVVSYPQSETNGTIVDRVPMLEAQRPSLEYQGEAQCSLKEALPETKILPKAEVDKEDHALDIRSYKSNQQQPLSFRISLPPQMQCSSTDPSVEKYAKKENTSRKRKSTQCPLVSSGDPVRSPVSKPGENSRMSTRAPYKTCGDDTNLGIHMDKAAVVPPASVGSDVYSLVRENQMSRNTKRTPKSRSKVSSQSRGCTESLVTVSDRSVQSCSNSSSMGTALLQPLAGYSGDPSILERLSKIVRVATRHGLSNKKNTTNEYLKRNTTSHFPLAPMISLPEDSEECSCLMDKMCMSKFLIRGNRNICKTRAMTFVRVRYFPRGNSHRFAVFDSWKLIFFESEKLEEHEIRAEVIFGEEDRIAITLLPSPHHADLFAAQFISLMEREGYELKNDQIQPTFTSFTDASSSNSVHIGSSGAAEISCAAPSTVQSLKQVSSYGSRISISNPHLLSARSVPTPIRDPLACFSYTRPKQLEIVAHLSSMQQPYSHNQSSMLSVRDNFWGNSPMQLGDQLPNNSRGLHPLQLQQYQQQQVQQQKILLSKMYSHGATGNGIGMGTHASGLTVSQIGDNLQQISGFGQSGVQFINGDNSQVQGMSRAKLRQTSIRGTGVMDGIPIKTLVNGNVRITGNVSSCIGQFQDTDNIQTGPSNVPFKHMNRKNYGHLKPMHIQQKEKKLHPPLHWQQLELVCSPLQDGSPIVTPLHWQQPELVSSPLQDGSPILTQMSQSTPASPRERSLGSEPDQANTCIANKHSPQLSS